MGNETADKLYPQKIFSDSVFNVHFRYLELTLHSHFFLLLAVL